MLEAAEGAPPAVHMEAPGCGDLAYGPVLGGIDVVALVNAGNGQIPNMNFQGVQEYSDGSLGGYEFWFMTVENLKLFQDNPTPFLPQLGGFCAWSLSGDDFFIPTDYAFGAACTNSEDG